MGRSTRTAARRTIDRRLAVFILAFALLAATTQQVAAASPPANDSVSNATPLTLDVPVEFDSTNATIAASDPTDCNGSHGPWPGPYHASVWFTFTAKTNGQYSVSASELLEIKVRAAALFAGISGKDILRNVDAKAAATPPGGGKGRGRSSLH